MQQDLARKIFVDGDPKKGERTVRSRDKDAARVYKALYEKVSEHHNAFAADDYLPTAQSFLQSMKLERLADQGVSRDTVTHIRNYLGKPHSSITYSAAHVSATKARGPIPKFMKRFRKLQAAAGKDEEDFTRALNGWFDQAAGEKPIQYSKYKDKHGEEGIRLLASHLLKKPSLEEEKAQMAPDPQLLFEQIKKSKTLNRLVADADRVNPASLYRAELAAQAVLANPKGDAPPPEEEAAIQQLLEDQGMVAPRPRSRKKRRRGPPESGPCAGGTQEG